ncbi:MAG: hypothetical protein GY715_18345 [Planctomycetes bacterium]|nr:hypothetical protein [Planctomycetota bacterium]
MSRSEVVERYFMEHRARVIDIAAFLDRLDRAQSNGDEDDDDFRVRALREAIELLIDGQPGRARRVLEHFSDHTTEPIESAGTKGAYGAVPPGGAGP